MAKLKSKRIRKQAPTVRQLAEEVKQAPSQRRRLPRFGLVRYLKPLSKPFRPVLKILAKLMPRYFINAWHELKQVTWPNRRDTWRLTLAVFIFAAVFGFAIYGVDKLLESLFKRFVLG